MKLVSRYKFSFLGLLLALFTLCSLSSQARREFSKTIKKEFEISATGTTNIYNKYGTVNINTWDRNRVKVEVQIVVKASGEEVAQAIFDRIDVAFTNSSSYVSAKTVIESTSNSWWKDNNNKADYSINYEVWMPPGNQLELEANYCDSKVAPLKSGATVRVKYGNLNMDGLGEDLNLALDYGNGTISKVGGNATIESAHCTLSLQEAKDIDIDSKYSTIMVEQAGDIRSDTKYDTYKLGAVGEFRNTGKYDNLEIQKAESVYIDSDYTHFFARSISKNLNIEISYGEVAVEEITKGFSSATLLGEYSDFKLGMANGASYELDANAIYAGIGYPQNLNVVYEKEKMNAHEVKGHTGNPGGATIKARLRYGALKVRSN